MPVQRKSEAIILKRFAYGEADLIVTFFSRDRGRMSGIAKSAMRSQKRFGGAFEPGTLVEMSYSERGGSGLASLSEARVLRPMNGAMKTLERINAAARAIELALAFLQEHQAAPEKFDLLKGRLSDICEKDSPALDSILFEIEWMRLSGFGPHIEGCAICDTEDSNGRWAFGFEQGGLLCGECSGTIGNSVRLGGLASEGFEFLRGKNDSADEINIAAAQGVMSDYIDHILGRRIKTGVRPENMKIAANPR